MSRLINFSTIGEAHNAPRYWLEGARLASLGFDAEQPISVRVDALRVVVERAATSGRAVSFRRCAGVAGGRMPILDLNSAAIMGGLAPFGELKTVGTFGRLEITPSARGFAILSGKEFRGPFRVLDVFAGGGTLSDAFTGPAWRVVGGVEVDPVFASEWSAKHPTADLIQGDFRRMLPEELPGFDVLIAGVPCSEHSNQGRAKKQLAGRPELGELGDLFVHVLGLIAARMPAAVVLENVPNFGTSLAGAVVVSNLRRLGYDVAETVIDGHGEWEEPTSRKRWVAVATLRGGFAIQAPGVAFAGTVGRFLDAPDAAKDAADAATIAGTLPGLRAHNARHAAKGNGFALTVLDGSETAAPVICKSYHKINSSGAFVATASGPRMLRKGEIERLQGQTVRCDHYSTAVQMLGQGVQTRIFSQIAAQLARHLQQ